MAYVPNAIALIPPVFGTLHVTEVKGYTQDIDKANKLLDDAGFTKMLTATACEGQKR